MRRRHASFALVALLAVAACGKTPATDTSAGVEVSGTPAQAVSLPDVEVDDVGAGDTVNLRSLLPSDRPLLLWFWAPH